MRFVVIAILVAARAAGASTDPKPPKGPAWVSGPDRAYNCTHYLSAASGYKQAPHVGAGELVGRLTLRAEAHEQRADLCWCRLAAHHDAEDFGGLVFGQRLLIGKRNEGATQRRVHEG